MKLKNKRLITSMMLFISVMSVGLATVNDFDYKSFKQVGAKAVSATVQAPSIKSADEVIEKLMKGNAKYVESKCNDSDYGTYVRKELLKNGQHPYAVIVGCTDSRVVPENIFNVGPGEILVSRGVGNVIDDTILGTVEFGVDYMKTPVVIVLGHQKCGAVGEAKEGYNKGNLGMLIKKIIPLYDKAKTQGGTADEIYERTVELNVQNSVELIKNDPNLKAYFKDDKAKVIGAVYSQETGEVKLLK